jgi:heme exporter protein D
MNGVVSGGWSFVWSAYAITAGVLAVYAIRVIAGFRNASREAGHKRQ